MQDDQPFIIDDEVPPHEGRQTGGTGKLVKGGRKLAVLLIAAGFLAGGITALFQSPPPLTASGWTGDLPVFSSYSAIPVPDVDGDGYDDIFYWVNANNIRGPVNPREMDDVARWNRTAGAALLSGKTGATITMVQYPGETLQLVQGATFLKHVPGTGAGSIVLAAVTVRNYTALEAGKAFSGYDLATSELLQVSLPDLAIGSRVNIFDAGWDFARAIEDNTNEQFSYVPDVRYILNNSVPAPGGGYTGDLLAIKNVLPYWNGTGYNGSIRQFSFVNPSTLETVSTIQWNNWPVMEMDVQVRSWGFCEGPVTVLEEGKLHPYFFVTYSQATGPTRNHRMLLTRTDLLGNDTASIPWLVNASIANMSGSFLINQTLAPAYPAPYYEEKCVLALNDTGVPAGFALLTNQVGYDNNTIQADRKYLQEFFQHVGPATLRKPMVSIVSAFSFDNGTKLAERRFQYSSLIEGPYTTGAPAQAFQPRGACLDVLPVRTGNDTNTTSFGLLFSRLTYRPEMLTSGLYPVTNYSVAFLNASAAGSAPGTPGAKYTLGNGTTGLVDGIEGFVTPVSRSGGCRSTADVDFDGDGRTDIALMGYIFNQDRLAKSEKTLNGPFFIVFNGAPGEQRPPVQEAYFTLRHLSQVRVVGDVNGDGIPDAVINNYAMAFGIVDPVTIKSDVDRKLEDPVGRILLNAGLVLTGAGIALLVAVLAMRGSSIKLAVMRKGRLVALSVAAFALIGALYIVLGRVVDDIAAEGATQFGSNPESVALQNLLSISGVATFVLFLALPLTLGAYILLAPGAASAIASFNKVFTKWRGEYRIVLVPPFGRQESAVGIASRVTSVLALSMSIGLYAFNFLATGVQGIVSVSAITDELFVDFITSLFLYLIIPGIVAIPLFFWLLPSTWLLDDAGVLFHLKRVKNRRPEDVESIGGWFSNYLKGFLGISAFINYVTFVMNSPIFVSYEALGSAAVPMLIFVFGFIIIAGISFGMLAVVAGEIVLPINASKLYARLEKAGVDIQRSGIEFTTHETLTPENTLDGFLSR